MGRQAIARVAVCVTGLCPSRLNHAQNSIQRIAAGIINQHITLGMRELESQIQTRLTVL